MKSRTIGWVVLLTGLALAPLLQRATYAAEPSQAPAQANVSPAQAKDMLVISFAGVERIWEDAAFIGKLAGVDNLAENLKQTLSAQTGEAGVPGVDAKSPCGVVVRTDGAQFFVLGYVPVTDLNKTIEFIKSRNGDITQENDLYKVNLPNGQSAFLMQKGQWAIISTTQPALQQAPQQPPQELLDLARKYDLAINAHIANIPPMFTQLALGMIQQGMQAGMQRQPNQTEEQFQSQKAMVERSFQQMQVAISEMDRIMLGFNIDSAQSQVVLDIDQLALPGTESAKEVALNKDLATPYAGFVWKDATFVVRETAKAGPRSVAQLKDILDQYDRMMSQAFKQSKMSQREQELVNKFVSAFLSAIKETAEKETFNLATSCRLDEKHLEGVFAFRLAGAEKVEKEIVEMLEAAAKDDPKAAESVKINAATYNGVRCHVVNISPDSLKEAPESLRQMLGANAAFVFAFGEKDMYMAFGPNAMELLKTALDASGKDVPVDKVLEMQLAVRPLAEFILQVAGDHLKPEGRDFVQQLLSSTGEKDRIIHEGTIIENGSRSHIVFEEDALKITGRLLARLIAQARAQAQSGAGLPDLPGLPAGSPAP